MCAAKSAHNRPPNGLHASTADAHLRDLAVLPSRVLADAKVDESVGPGVALQKQLQPGNRCDRRQLPAQCLRRQACSGGACQTGIRLRRQTSLSSGRGNVVDPTLRTFTSSSNIWSAVHAPSVSSANCVTVGG